MQMQMQKKKHERIMMSIKLPYLLDITYCPPYPHIDGTWSCLDVLYYCFKKATILMVFKILHFFDCVLAINSAKMNMNVVLRNVTNIVYLLLFVYVLSISGMLYN